MKTLEKINHSKELFAVILIGIFLLMLCLNFLTPYLSDDFDYKYSYATGEPISGPLDIFPSMAAHRNILGGRVVAHFFVQLFLWLPKWVFNLVNAFMFTLLIYLIYRLSAPEKSVNNIYLFSVFGAVWYFELSFGQVNLWLDGSVNYLWACVFCLLYFVPLMRRYFEGKGLKNPAYIAMYLLYCLLFGAYSENGSLALIVLAVLILVLIRFKKNETVQWYYISGVALSGAGYMFLMTAPAVGAHRTALDLASVGNQFATVMSQYGELFPLLALYAVLMILALFRGTNREVLSRCGLFFLGSLIANFAMLAASYYADRSAAVPCVLLIVADGTLIFEMFRSSLKPYMLCLLAVMSLLTLFKVTEAAKDVYTCYRKVGLVEEYILDRKAAGETAVLAPIPFPESKYSALYGLIFLNQDDSDTFPNDAIKKYYGLDSILGFIPGNETIWRSGPLSGVFDSPH